jgi:SAM-dependent methyltransferase
MKKRIYIQDFGKYPNINQQQRAEKVCSHLFKNTEVDIVGTDTTYGLRKIEGTFDLIIISGSSLSHYGISEVKKKLKENGKIISFTCDQDYLPWLYENIDYVFYCFAFDRLREEDPVFKSLQEDCKKVLAGESIYSPEQEYFLDYKKIETMENRLVWRKKHIRILMLYIAVVCITALLAVLLFFSKY